MWYIVEEKRKRSYQLEMNKGKRYEEPKLNLKKVFAVIIAIIVVIMFIFIIKGILTKDKEQVKITSKDYFVVYQNNKWGIIDSARKYCN